MAAKRFITDYYSSQITTQTSSKQKQCSNKNSSDLRKVPQQQIGCNADKGVPQQKKNVDVNQSPNSSKTTGLSSEGETADKNEDVTMMSETSKTIGNVALRTVSVYLKNGDRKLKINALLDNASTKT